MWRVSYPLLRAGAGLCVEKTVAAAGFEYWNRYSLGEALAAAMTTSYGLGEPLEIFTVATDSPAARADLQAGDRLLAVGGQAVAEGAGADPAMKRLLADTLHESQADSFRVQRGDRILDKVLVPEPICDFGVYYSPRQRAGAFSDGDTVVVTRGMMSLAANDLELSQVVAREIAHAILRHALARTTYQVLGNVVDVLAATQGIMTQGAVGEMAARINAEEFEAEADYLGLYLMARAGLAIDAAPEFWERLTRNPVAVSGYAAAVPEMIPGRLLGMRQTIREIREKQATGAPLIPELSTSDDYSRQDGSGSNR